MILAWWIACQGPPLVDDADTGRADAPVVVLWSVDTLGATAAAETGWCEALSAQLARYGRDLACVPGGVSPSSWTGEAHTRILWPAHQAGELRREVAPACGASSVHGVLGEALGATVSWGADNMVLGGEYTLCDGRPSWYQGADIAYATDRTGVDLAAIDEVDRPVARALDEVLGRIALGAPVVAFFNSFEVGGHFPRCFFATDTEACAAMWDLAVDARLVGNQADPKEMWLDPVFQRRFIAHVANERVDEAAVVRPLFWTSMKESIAHHHDPRFEDRLERLLQRLEAQNRLDDLVLVVFGDHGETPCEQRPVGDRRLSCSHGGLPNEFTAQVPVFVSPASFAAEAVAAGWIADDGRPWSVGNLGVALLDGFDVPAPASWPAPEPVGAATVLTCKRQDEETNAGPRGAGARIVGDAAVRCQGEDCVPTTWSTPLDSQHQFTILDAAPPELASWAGSWAIDACNRP